MSNNHTTFKHLLFTVFFVIFSIAFSYSQSYNLVSNSTAWPYAATASGDCYTLTTGYNKNFLYPNGFCGAVWYTDLLDLSKEFDLEFDVNLGNRSATGSGGDGMVFVMQTVGNTALGTPGLGMGFQGFSPSLGVEFDTYDNYSGTPSNGDISLDHVGLLKNGSINHLSTDNLYDPTQANASGELEDGNDHHVRIHWDPATFLFEVYVECQLKISKIYDISTNVFGGTKKVYWGFTAATGGVYNVQKVCIQKSVLAVADTVKICSGSSSLLNAIGAGTGTTYLWTPNYNISSTTIQQPSVFPLQDTTYYVDIIDACGYVRKDSVRVLVSPKPVVNLGADTSICTGVSKILDAGNPGSTYKWSTPPTTRAITVNTSGTYRVTVTSANACTGTDAIVVTVRSLPTANAGTDKTMCSGASATLSGWGGVTYNWSSSDLTATSVVSPSSTSTYTLTVANTYGCTATDFAVVTVNAGVTANAGTDQNVCSGGSASLSATGGTTYVWNDAGANPHNVSPLVNTTYTVTATTGTCTGTDAVVVTVGNVVAKVGNDTTICSGSSLLLTATGGGSYLWSTGEVTSSITVNPLVKTTYSVIVSSGFCTDSDNIVVSMYTLPTADAGALSTICSGSTANLTASGGVSYVWNTTDATQSIAVKPLVNTTYSVTVTNANGCTDEDTVSVLVKAVPTANAGADSLICAGDSVNLVASGGTSYAWNTSQTVASIIVKPFITTTYLVTATQNACTDIDQVVVSVNSTIADPGNDTTVCPGSLVTLTAKGGSSYNWSTSASTASIVVSPLVTSTYSVTVTNGFCSASDRVIVSMYTLPVADAGNDITICKGATPSLTASGGISYQWNTGASTAVISVSPVIQTSYTVTVTDINGCVNKDSVQVNIQDSLNITAGNDTTICSGSSLTLVATGGAFYNWNTGSTLDNITVTPSSNITYTVTGTDGGLCVGVNSVIVTVKNSPTANAGVDDSICSGETVVLKATGGGTYAWSTGDLVDSTTVSPLVATTYIVTVSNGTCSDTDDVIVYVSNFAIAGGVNDTSICNGNSVLLSASGGVTYKWSTTESGSSISVAPLNTSTYTVTITDIKGCTGSQDVIVVIDPLPVFTISPVSAICEGEQVAVNALPITYTYEWNTGAINNTLFASPLVSTTYTVTATSIKGCSATATQGVVVNLLPTASIVGNDSACPGASVSLTASGGDIYSWSTSQSSASITITPFIQTTYVVTVTTVSTGCTASDSIIVTMNTVPTADITGVSKICAGKNAILVATGGTTYKWSTSSVNDSITIAPVSTLKYTVTAYNTLLCSDSKTWAVIIDSTPVANAGSDKSVCLGKSIAFTASGGTNYLWSTIELSATIVVVPAITSTYTVTAAFLNGCTSSDEVVAIVNKNPTIDIGNDLTICAGGSASLNPIASGGDNNYSYQWDNVSASASRTVAPAVTTSYTITLTDGKTCTATDYIVVAIGSTLVPSITNDTILCAGSCIQLQVSGGVNYTWSDGLGTTANPTACPLATTTYTVSVNDGGTCSGTGEVIVSINQAPPVKATADTPVYCTGGSTSIQVVGGNTYIWSTSETSSTIAVSPVTTQTYTVTGYDNIGCSGKDEVVVSVNANPVLNLGADLGVCKNGSTIVKAAPTGGDGFYTYLWSNAETDSSFIYTAVDTITFKVTVTDGNGCTDSDDLHINIDIVLGTTITNNTAICINSCLQLNVTGGLNYSWSPLAGLSSINISNPVACPVVETTYIVVVDDGATCSATDSVIVSLKSLPIADAGKDTLICEGTQVDLSAQGGASYKWSTSEISSIISVKPVTTKTTYTVTVTQNGCTDSDNVTVTLKPTPVAIITSFTGTDSICPNESALLMVAGGDTYLWNTGLTTFAVSFQPLVNTTYTVTATTNNCSDTATFSVIVKKAVKVDAGEDQIVCKGANVVISANTIKGYIWNTTSTAQSIFVTPLLTTTYTVTGTDILGCTSSDNVIVDVHAIPVANAGLDTSMCIGSSHTLTGAGSINYKWNSGQLVSLFSVTPLATTTYILTVSDDIGCADEDSVVVTINLLPTAKITGTLSICKGQSDTLTASGSSVYNWSSSEATAIIIAKPAATSTYTVTVSTLQGCTATASYKIQVNQLPLTPSVSDVKVCKGMDAQGIYKVISPINGLTYKWYNTETSTTYLTKGTYLIFVHGVQPKVYVEAIDTVGCISSSRGMAQMISGIEPIAAFSVDLPKAIINNVITFTDNSVNAIKWDWTFGDSYESTETSPQHYFEKQGTYKIDLIVTSSDGCKDTASIDDYLVSLAERIYVADAFTPNGDNQNDVLHVLGSDIPFTFQIYDQWGIKVFESTVKSIGWDGSYNNKKQPSGNYTYILNATTSDGNPINMQGVVSLIR